MSGHWLRPSGLDRKPNRRQPGRAARSGHDTPRNPTVILLPDGASLLTYLARSALRIEPDTQVQLAIGTDAPKRHAGDAIYRANRGSW